MDRKQKTSKEAAATTTVPFWRQLRVTLIVSLILFAVIPVLATLTIILRQIDVRMRQQVEQQLESVAELKIDQIESWLDNSQSFLALILANPATESQIFSLITSVSNHELSSEQIQQHPISELLHKKLSAQKTFEEFFIYTRRGQVIASSDADQIGGFVTNEHYFLDSLKAQTIQSPYYELGRDELTMVITLPLVDPTTSKTVGVIAGRLSLDTLGEVMTERTGLGDTGETYLISPDNYYLVTPSRYEAEGYTLNQTYRSVGIDRALNGENGTDTYLDYRDPGVPVIGVYRWLPQLQVGMLAEVDEAEALTLFNQVQNLSSILLGVTILIAIGIGLFVAARISQPISTLTKVAIRISQGDFHQQANVKRRNEIGVLATAFNTMTGQLRETIDNLEQSQATFRNIIDSVPMGMYLYHLEPDNRLIFDGVNPAAQKMFAFASNEMVNQPIETTFPGLGETELPGRFREVAISGETWQTEFVYSQEIEEADATQSEVDLTQNIYQVYVFQTSPDNIVAAFLDVTESKQAEQERERLQQEVIEAQKQVIREISTPVIPIMDNIIVMPLIGSIDSMRARDITRTLLTGISQRQAKAVILDVTGVPFVDTGVINHLNKTVQAARLKGARVIVTGISEAVAETIVDLGIDWSRIETLSDLQTGLVAALNGLGIKLTTS